MPTPFLPFPLTVASPAALVRSARSAALLCTFPAQTIIPVIAQPAAFAADWDKKNSNTLLKFSNGARFTEASGDKIRGFIAAIELYLHVLALSALLGLLSFRVARQ